MADQAPSDLRTFWQQENDYWTKRANEEAASGNRYEEHAYRTAAHAIRMARDKWEAAAALQTPENEKRMSVCNGNSASGDPIRPPSTPDPYPVLHKYMDASTTGWVFLIADEDMAAFYDEQYLHARDGCTRCRRD